MPELEHVDLPNGAWAKFRDPDDITEAQRRPAARFRERIGLDGVLRYVYTSRTKAEETEDDGPAPVVEGPTQADLTDAQLDLLTDYMNATIVALVEEWSFEQPVTVEGLLAIKGRKNYEALALEAGKRREAMFADFDPDPDPESPTVASDGSGRPSEAAVRPSPSNGLESRDAVVPSPESGVLTSS